MTNYICVICMNNSFHDTVYEIVKQIPKGKVATYGQLTGYSACEGLKTKREMLEQEGVVFIRDKANLAMSKWKEE